MVKLMPSHHPAKILSRIKNKSIRNPTVHKSMRATFMPAIANSKHKSTAKKMVTALSEQEIFTVGCLKIGYQVESKPGRPTWFSQLLTNR